MGNPRGPGKAALPADWYEDVLDFVPDGLVVADANGVIRFVNRRAESMFGRTRSELVGRPIATLAPKTFEAMAPECWQRALAGDFTAPPDGVFMFTVPGTGGVDFDAEVTVAPFDLQGTALLSAVVRDRRERAAREAEQQRAEARRRIAEQAEDRRRRLDALSRLAGGVASELNNALTVIASSAELLAAELARAPFAEESQAIVDLGAISSATERAACLTGRLLMFSPQETTRPEPYDLAVAVRSQAGPIAEVVGPSVSVDVAVPDVLPPVRIDPVRFRVLLLELAANAAEAMAGRGRLRISVADVMLDLPEAGRCGVLPGRYVRLTVTDEGPGMTEEVRARALDPFFTTKADPAGAGLGLPLASGLGAEVGGHLELLSEPGRGTTVTIHLPAEAGPAPLPLVLVVDDDAAVGNAAARILERAGYSVLVARSADEALDICRRHAGPIDLLLSDVMMPDLPGPDLVRRALVDRPGMAVLYMSGYAGQLLAGSAGAGVEVVAKPFSSADLLGGVRRVLGKVQGSNR